MMFGVFSTIAGVGLVALVIRDVFHQIFHPQGSGRLTGLVALGLWRGFRVVARRRPRALDLAGPSIVVAVVVSWMLLMAVGWALIFWPRLPTDFHVGSGLPPLSEGHFLDALYLSLTSLTTVGYGDLTPVTMPMRLAAVTEAAVGFGLLTASISWVLSLYPVLQRRRVAAVQITLYCRESGPATEGPLDDDIGARLIDVAVDTLHFPTAYYFHDSRDDELLPLALLRLEARLERATTDVARGPDALSDSLDAVRDRLRQHPALSARHLPLDRVLHAYAADHLVDRHREGPQPRIVAEP